MNAPRKPLPADGSPRAQPPRADADDAHRRVAAPRFRWQFSLSALFGTMLLLCVPFAIWGAILRADADEQLMLTVICIAAPLAVLVATATAFSLRRAIRTRRRSNLEGNRKK